MGAKALGDNTGFVGHVTLDQFFSGEPFEAVRGAEYVSSVGAAGGAAALAAMAQIKCVEGSADLVLDSPTEAGTFNWFAHVHSP